VAAPGPADDPLDFYIVKNAPPAAKGKWLIFKPRFVTSRTVRGPTVVLTYETGGRRGFVKVPYDTLWGAEAAQGRQDR
jgi:hypothetical protein